jgi:hypothetical protein
MNCKWKASLLALLSLSISSYAMSQPASPSAARTDAQVPIKPSDDVDNRAEELDGQID